MRLIQLSEFVKMDGIPPFEAVPQGAAIDCSIETFLGTLAPETVAVSYRRVHPEPENLADAISGKALGPVPRDLPEFVSRFAEDRSKGTLPPIQYIWLDWLCIPQYSQADLAMQELNNSGLYYRSAGHIAVWCYSQLNPATSEVVYSDYFSRAWTLAERMHRATSRQPLRVSDLLPSWLNADGPDFFLKKPDAWKPLADEAKEWLWWDDRMPVFFEVMRSIQRDRKLTEVSVEKVARVLVSRYPPVARIDEEVIRPLAGSIEPVAAIALNSTIVLRAISAWIRDSAHSSATLRPAGDDVLRMNGIEPVALKIALLGGAQRLFQLRCYNRDAALSWREDEDFILAAPNLEKTFRDQDSAAALAALDRLDECLEQLWRKAVDMPLTECPIGRAWLRRYLLFEAGRKIRAGFERDLWFSIYKLFDLPDHAYGEEVQLWRELAGLAGLETDTPYGWLRDIARPCWDSDYAGKHSSTVDQNDVLLIAVNRKLDAHSVSPRNFGVTSLDNGRFKPFWTTLVGGSLRNIPGGQSDDPPARIFKNAQDGRSVPQALFTTYGSNGNPRDHYSQHLLGARLTDRQAYALRDVQVPKVEASGAMSHKTKISLRGYHALEQFEPRLQDAVRQVAKEGPIAPANGLFVCIQHGNEGYARALVLWVSADHPEGALWHLEALASVGSAPMKGTTWGVATVLDNLIIGLVAIGVAATEIGMQINDQTRGLRTPDAPMIPVFGTKAPWMQEWILAVEPREPPDRVSALDAAVTPETQPGASLLQMVDQIVGSGFPTDSHPGLERASKAALENAALIFSRIHETGFTQTTATDCFQMFRRLHAIDSKMARQLPFYALFGAIVAHGVRATPVILNEPLLRLDVQYLAEDLGDASRMTEDKDAIPAALRAKEALVLVLQGNKSGRDVKKRQ